jgi:nitrate reductase (NAD(P)H)
MVRSGLFLRSHKFCELLADPFSAGYPLRLVVPGQIGGRSVKWLKKIIISDKESQHHLHFFDNKVLPGTLTAEEARDTPSVWYDPR